MKLFVKSASLFLLLLVCVSCGDGNALSWMANKNTSEANQDKIDFAFIQNNCSYVIEMYAPREGLLNATEQYKYSNALLACSGFDLVGSIDIILDKDKPSSDPFNIIQTVLGTNTINAAKAEQLKKSYQDVLKGCTGKYMSDDQKTICGMAAAADTIMTVSGVALALSGKDNISITKEGITEIIEGKTLPEIETAVKEAKLDFDSLSNDLNVVTEAASAIEALAEGSVNFSKDLDKLTKDLKDPSSGKMTESSLTNYINSQFKNSKGGN